MPRWNDESLTTAVDGNAERAVRSEGRGGYAGEHRKRRSGRSGLGRLLCCSQEEGSAKEDSGPVEQEWASVALGEKEKLVETDPSWKTVERSADRADGTAGVADDAPRSTSDGVHAAGQDERPDGRGSLTVPEAAVPEAAVPEAAVPEAAVPEAAVAHEAIGVDLSAFAESSDLGTEDWGYLEDSNRGNRTPPSQGRPGASFTPVNNLSVFEEGESVGLEDVLDEITEGEIVQQDRSPEHFKRTEFRHDPEKNRWVGNEQQFLETYSWSDDGSAEGPVNWDEAEFPLAFRIEPAMYNEWVESACEYNEQYAWIARAVGAEMAGNEPRESLRAAVRAMREQ